MKNPIYKRSYRQIYFKPLSFIPIFVALCFIVIFSSSFYTAQNSTKKLYWDLVEKGKVEDANFTSLEKLDQATIKDLENKKVKVYENFYVEEKLPGKKDLRIFENRDSINLPSILEGRLAEKNDEICLSANYARANKIKIGDNIVIGGKTYKLKGLVALADYSTLLKNSEDLVMDTGYFGTALIAKGGLKNLHGQIKYQYSYHDTEKLAKAKANDKLKDIIKIVNKKNLILDASTRYDNKCITYFTDDMGGDVPMMTSAMIVLIIAIAFISSIQVKTMIEDEAPIIGSLLASGYKKRELKRAYMLMPIFLSLISSLIGNIIAYSHGYKKYTDLYYNSYDLPKFKVTFDLRSFILTSLIPLIIYLIINYLVISKALKHEPIDFLRNTIKSPKAKTRLRLDKFSFLNKFRIRVILSNKANIVSLIFGIGLANILLIYSLSLKPIFYDYASNMKNSMKYEHNYIVKTSQENIKADKLTLSTLKLVDHDMKKVQTLGVDEKSKYQNLSLAKLKDKDVIISSGLAKNYKYKIGDKIKLVEAFNDKEIILRVCSIDKSNKQFQFITRRDILNKIIAKDKDYFNCYGSDKKLDINKDLLMTEINREEMDKFMTHFMDSFGGIFETFLVITIIFYLIISFLVASLIVDKSKTNISYLKIFGMKNRESTSIYTSPIFAILIVFELLIIPLIDFSIKKLMRLALTKFDAYVDVNIPPMIYLKAIFLSLLIFIFVQLLEEFRISRIDMVKELKIING